LLYNKKVEKTHDKKIFKIVKGIIPEPICLPKRVPPKNPKKGKNKIKKNII